MSLSKEFFLKVRAKAGLAVFTLRKIALYYSEYIEDGGSDADVERFVAFIEENRDDVLANVNRHTILDQFIV
ncbi:hypothetical protein kac65v162_gp074 [Nodularia phage vB_NspS-kac65v162]|jgi:hypothetical protein|uniref:Uncharacterized protein n=1 Tax=Nodularia phage vB_NspS-kac65v162 TaxID=2557581 RepID=A0A482MIS6_9CAUD|nr:hypothetical protein kac65v162_gp074 [Nodularia phage vB_NspS-kac65v162]